MAGPLKKHHEAVVTASYPSASDATTATCTPVRRPPPAIVSSSSDASPVGLEDEPEMGSDKKKKKKTRRPSTTPSTLALPPAVADATNKRKRTSVRGSTSTVATASASSQQSAHKKRTRVSIGTPGKAVPLDNAREQDVAKRFVDLEVTDVYRAIRKQTGALGGNAAGGAIYGEITQLSFQRVVDYMKAHCELSETSLFLDVGSGLGKPNFHVAIDPGVEVSYGVELEELRWHLSLHNLRSVLQLDSQSKRPNRTMFSAGDITAAATLNPFSHVYSFDVGFPPAVMDTLAATFNRSSAGYFVSFHAPRKVIDVYGFAVENVGRLATAMAGSSEGHTCYFYRRLPDAVVTPQVTRTTTTTSGSINSHTRADEQLLHIDPLFRAGFDVLRRGRDETLAWIVSFFGDEGASGRTRGQKAKHSQLTRLRQERPLESYYRVVGKARSANVVVAGEGLQLKPKKACA